MALGRKFFHGTPWTREQNFGSRIISIMQKVDRTFKCPSQEQNSNEFIMLEGIYNLTTEDSEMKERVRRLRAIQCHSLQVKHLFKYLTKC